MAQPKPFGILQNPNGFGTWKLFVMYDEGAESYYGQVHAPLGHIAIVSDYFPAGPGVAARVALHTSQLLKNYFDRRNRGRNRR